MEEGNTLGLQDKGTAGKVVTFSTGQVAPGVRYSALRGEMPKSQKGCMIMMTSFWSDRREV